MVQKQFNDERILQLVHEERDVGQSFWEIPNNLSQNPLELYLSET